MKHFSNGGSHATAEYRAAAVGRFRSSGLTQREFARRQKLNLGTFRNWLYKPGAGNLSGPQPVAMQEIGIESLLKGDGWAAEVAFSSGTVVRIRPGADPGWVKSILEPFHRPC
jgi:hypothetical protein